MATLAARRHQPDRGAGQLRAGGAPPRAEVKAEATLSPREAPEQRPTAAAGSVYVTIGLSGACALGAEVVWTRLMGMMLGATVYVFSIILAVFLIGLALGSGAGRWLLRRYRAAARWRWDGARFC